MIVETQDINVPACRFYEAGYVLTEINPRASADLPDEVQLIWQKDLGAGAGRRRLTAHLPSRSFHVIAVVILSHAAHTRKFDCMSDEQQQPPHMDYAQAPSRGRFKWLATLPALLIGIGVIALAGSVLLPSTKRAHVNVEEIGASARNAPPPPKPPPRLNQPPSPPPALQQCRRRRNDP